MMKGQILDYSPEQQSGVISGEDGNRYTFVEASWKDSSAKVARGLSVDFEVQGSEAINIYKVIPAGASSGSKNKIVAGLFAIFLGGLGIHKFYLGYIGPGLVYLLINTIGWAVTIFLFGIPNMILGVIALIEGILYLTKSDAEFEEIYVNNRKSWF